MKIELHAAVLAQDLPAIYSFIAKADPDAAERVLDGVEQTFEVLAHQPVSGVRYPTRNPLLQNVRMLRSTIFRTISYSTASKAPPSMCSTSSTGRVISRGCSAVNLGDKRGHRRRKSHLSFWRSQTLTRPTIPSR